MKVRTVTKENSLYKYKYTLENFDQELDLQIFDTNQLTFRQHFLNQFYNELIVLLSLQKLDFVPRIVEYDIDTYTIFVSDAGLPIKADQVFQLESFIDKIAALHEHFNCTKLQLKDVWHSVVTLDYYISASKEMKIESKGYIELMTLDNTLCKRISKSDCVINNFLSSDQHTIFIIDFETCHMGLQKIDLVELVWDYSIYNNYLNFDQFEKGWQRYASVIAVNEQDYIEYILGIIRKCFWSLRKPKHIFAEEIKKLYFKAIQFL